MKLQLISVSSRQPDWVTTGYQEYAKRLPKTCELSLVEIPLSKFHKQGDANRACKDEGERIIKAIPKHSHIIALEVNGKNWSTAQLADQLQSWQQQHSHISLLIGGPEGLDENCRQQAQQQWSLSPLTLPHALVRILVAEQIYRAWSMLNNHPYHRG